MVNSKKWHTIYYDDYNTLANISTLHNSNQNKRVVINMHIRKRKGWNRDRIFESLYTIIFELTRIGKTASLFTILFTPHDHKAVFE